MKPIDFGRLLAGLDFSQAFKTKGDQTRWSAKRTIGGVIALTACNDIVQNGISWPAVAMCAISIVPISLSFFERE